MVLVPIGYNHGVRIWVLAHSRVQLSLATTIGEITSEYSDHSWPQMCGEGQTVMASVESVKVTVWWLHVKLIYVICIYLCKYLTSRH